MISNNALRYFTEVARCGSFRAAAEQLFVAASAISRQISLLEANLGAPLFERSRGRKALRLTAAGELLMQYVINTDNEMVRVRSEIEALKGVRRGQVMLGVPESFVRDFLPDVLVRFQQRYPRITYNIQVAGTPRLLEMVASGELELALTFNPQPMTDIQHIHEVMLATSVLVPASHPLAKREWVRLSDCAEYGIALPDHSVSAKVIYDEMFAKARIKPKPVLVTNSYELLRSAAMAGLAITIVNSHLTHTPDNTGAYCYVPLRDPRVKPQRLTCCVRRDRNLPVTALTFIEHLKQEFALLENDT